MVTHYSTAWRTPWTEEPGVPQSMGSQRVGYNLVTEQQQKGTKEHLNFPRTYVATHSCSCLENPRDGRAWWAAVYGVSQSRTRLK